MPVSTATGRRGAMARIRRGLACCAALGVLIAGQISFARACQTTDEAGATPGLSSGWQKLYQIAARFGQSEWPPDPQMPGWLTLEELATESPSLDLTLAALAQSNAQGDLSAPPIPTGDNLFDRYALAVDASMSAYDGSDRAVDPQLRYIMDFTGQEPPNYAALDDAALAEWEPEFGQDPRYWELRFLCALGQDENQCLAPGFTQAVDFLAEAQRRGIATANTLFLLAAYAPDERSDEEWEQSLNAALRLDPDLAWPHYYLAISYFQAQELELGLHEMQLGNAAPNFHRPQPFPLDFVDAGLTETAPKGSAAVSGAILWLDTSTAIESQIGFSYHISKMIDSTLTTVSAAKEGAVSNAWYQFACRYGRSSVKSLDANLAMGMCMTIRRYWAVSTRSKTPVQEGTLNRLHGAYQVSRQILHGKSGIPAALKLVCMVTGGSHGVAVGNYLEAEGDIGYSSAYHQILDDLAQVHYPELATPECLLKYEPLTQEDIDRLNAARKAARSKEDGQE